MDRQAFLPNFNLWPRIGYEYDLEAVYTNIGYIKCVSPNLFLFEVCEKCHFYFLCKFYCLYTIFYIGRVLSDNLRPEALVYPSLNNKSILSIGQL